LPRYDEGELDPNRPDARITRGPLPRVVSASLIALATASLVALLVVLARVTVDRQAAPSGSPIAPSRLLLTGPRAGDTPPVWGAPDVWLRAVDPTTLADLPGYAPIDFGHNDTSTLSPDGKTLAAFVWPSPDPQSGGVLHLVDVASGSDSLPGVTVGDFVLAPTFSPDGRTLYWINPAFHEALHSWPDGWDVFRFSLGDTSPTLVSELPNTLAPRQARALPNGTLAIYGIPTAPSNMATDAPHLLLVDVASGQVRTDLRLDGIRDGNVPPAGPSTDGADFPTYQPGVAWDLARERLDVIDPGTERIVAVDLGRGSVIERGEIRPPASWLTRLMRWLFPPAEAKGGPLTREVAEVSPDGGRLYLSGSSEGRPATSTGVKVVDTGDRSLIQSLDLQVSDLALSPDGGRLVLNLSWRAASGNPPRPSLAILDAGNLARLGQIAFDEPFGLVGFSPDGRDVYVGRNVEHPDHTGEWRISVVDVAAQRIVAERGFSTNGAPAFVSMEGVWRNGIWQQEVW
jgi:dipeptidyl aminopeptidase/acylaminoacyl peptidase